MRPNPEPPSDHPSFVQFPPPPPDPTGAFGACVGASTAISITQLSATRKPEALTLQGLPASAPPGTRTPIAERKSATSRKPLSAASVARWQNERLATVGVTGSLPLLRLIASNHASGQDDPHKCALATIPRRSCNTDGTRWSSAPSQQSSFLLLADGHLCTGDQLTRSWTPVAAGRHPLYWSRFPSGRHAVCAAD